MSSNLMFFIEVERNPTHISDLGVKAIVHILNLNFSLSRTPATIKSIDTSELAQNLTHLILEKAPIQVIFEGVGLSYALRDMVFNELDRAYNVNLDPGSGYIYWPKLEPKIHSHSTFEW